MSNVFSTLENSAQNNSPAPTQVVPAGQGPAQRLSLMYSGSPTWSLHLVEVPASYFPLELALGCYILGTNTLALWFSFLLLGISFLVTKSPDVGWGKTRWWQRTELLSSLLYLAAWWKACGKEGRLERSGGEAWRLSLSSQTCCQEVNAMGRMDGRWCIVHDCNTQELPPDGDDGFLALWTLGRPFPVKVSRACITLTWYSGCCHSYQRVVL